MTRDTFVQKVDALVKLVRTEYGLTQEQMAQCLGISKKTLVGIEKGRGSLGWTGTAAICSLFSESTVLQNTFGGEMSDILKAYAFEHDGRAHLVGGDKAGGGLEDPAELHLQALPPADRRQ